ncbi:phosphotransferase [Thermoactinospora rubra]|uniref:phosphotransferase n=1 Tax=Thermoactinospora rubra TaxID=1088767 RepID=UPI000A104799|nr:phosphotransferase [Thermoactinospora rubra]
MVTTLAPEVPLPGGHATEGVVRIGDTVRRPTGPHTAKVHALLRHLEHAGFQGAPRVVGTDAQGREILTFIPGTAGLTAASATDEALVRLAALVREFHEATRGFPLDPDGWAIGSNDDAPADVIGHCDITPENTIFRDRTPVALIDFDLARPTTRLFDIATTLRHWAPIADPVDRDPLLRQVDVGARLRLFCEAYGLAPRDRRRLLDVARLRLHRSYTVMRARASEGGSWARMWANGAGQRIRRAAAWLDAHEDDLRTALI